MQFIASLVGNQFTKPDGKARFAELDRGHAVKLVRAPDNQYDANAIEVHTPDGIMLGHVNKEVAADLAPILDATEGSVADGHEPEVERAEVYDLTNPKKPTLIIEVSTGWEVDTLVNEADAFEADDEDGED